MPEPSERSPIAQAPLSVVLPAHNVESNLEPAVRAWLTFLDSLRRDYEIFVVNDGSTDRTAEHAEALTRLSPRLQVLHHGQASGIGASLRTGLAAARLPLLCYAECSPAYQPAALAKMLQLIDHV